MVFSPSFEMIWTTNQSNHHLCIVQSDNLVQIFYFLYYANVLVLSSFVGMPVHWGPVRVRSVWDGSQTITFLPHPPLGQPYYSQSYSEMVNRLHSATQSAHCLTFTHSCTHSFTHSSTDSGVDHAGRQPAGQDQPGRGVSLRDTSALSEEEPGIQLANFWLAVNPLCLLRPLPPGDRAGPPPLQIQTLPPVSRSG